MSKIKLIPVLFILHSFISLGQSKEIKIFIDDENVELLIQNALKGDADVQMELGARYFDGIVFLKIWKKVRSGPKKVRSRAYPTLNMPLAFIMPTDMGLPKI
jgi:hypothetical protein